MRVSMKGAALLALAIPAASFAAEFKVTVTNFGPQPLSPLFFAASNNQFDEFDAGSSASLGIKHIAEMGDASSELVIAAAAGSDIGAYGLVGSAPLVPGLSKTGEFWTDSAHPFFSFAAMLGKTNDGFIGESISSASLMLFQGGKAQSFTYDIFGSQAWDAGTEANTQNAVDLAFLGGSGNPADPTAFVHTHPGVIPGVGDSWQLMPAWTPETELAQVRVQAVPSPSAALMLATGLVAVVRRKKQRS